MSNDINENEALYNIVKVLDACKSVFLLSGYGQGEYSISVSYFGDEKCNSETNTILFNLTKIINMDSEISGNNVLFSCQKILLVM